MWFQLPRGAKLLFAFQWRTLVSISSRNSPHCHFLGFFPNRTPQGSKTRRVLGLFITKCPNGKFKLSLEVVSDSRRAPTGQLRQLRFLHLPEDARLDLFLHVARHADTSHQNDRSRTPRLKCRAGVFPTKVLLCHEAVRTPPPPMYRQGRK